MAADGYVINWVYINPKNLELLEKRQTAAKIISELQNMTKGFKNTAYICFRILPKQDLEFYQNRKFHLF